MTSVFCSSSCLVFLLLLNFAEAKLSEHDDEVGFWGKNFSLYTVNMICVALQTYIWINKRGT